MSTIPDGLYYTAEHEWVSEPAIDGTVRVGITDFAQDALGDVVYVQMPEAGTGVTGADVIGEVESTKSVSDIYAPVTGEIVARNEALDDDPSLINSDPYGEGWLLEIKVSDPSVVQGLLSSADYSQQVG
ncbi:glycine cleavage system protein GcvH [Arthrobacter sp. NamB2]|uniref:glycine cleavage system protein GcvH n=1 Tax=unclassified Arthrobacter TaxID=235627 RepID=UPI000CE396BA|nr:MULTISPECIES: glycine cleavage system protein GcvH [unclassified Arthrobacter]TKV28255.1 glycine cleavage system protein GcvH [Arthrobacter sp. NamB2]